MTESSRSVILTPALCRAARGFLHWTQSDLADHAGFEVAGDQAAVVELAGLRRRPDLGRDLAEARLLGRAFLDTHLEVEPRRLAGHGVRVRIAVTAMVGQQFVDQMIEEEAAGGLPDRGGAVEAGGEGRGVGPPRQAQRSLKRSAPPPSSAPRTASSR